MLRGSPQTVVGTTDQVAGEIAIDLNDLSTTNRADFNLNIPSVPFVADVSEEVTLALSFVAPAA